MKPEKEKKSLAKKLWWLPFLAVFVFLLAGGYYAVVSMRDSAQKLAAGDKFGEMSSNSAVYSGNEGGAASFDSPVFAKEEGAAADGKKEEPAAAHLNPRLAGKWADGDGSAAAQAAAAGPGQEEAGGAAAAGTGGSLAAGLRAGGGQLQARAGRGPASAASGKTAAFGVGPGSLATVTGSGKALNAAGTRKAGGGGVLDTLRGAFKASVYGSRVASEDSAKNWTARSFDAVPGSPTTLQYSEKMRQELDTVNPNSIPEFLRDQDLSEEGIKKVGTSQVSRPDLDKEATKAAAERAVEEGASNLFSGMMNGMFAGLGPKPKAGAGEAGGGEGGVEGMGLMSDNNKQDPGYTDEFGYTHYGPQDGFQTIFDENGNQVGCTDNAGGFSIPFGAPGCP